MFIGGKQKEKISAEDRSQKWRPAGARRPRPSGQRADPEGRVQEGVQPVESLDYLYQVLHYAAVQVSAATTSLQVLDNC